MGPVRHCVACGRKHPLLQERKNRGEIIPTHEYTCALAIKNNITYEEANR